MEGKVEQIFDVTLGIELRAGKTVFSDLWKWEANIKVTVWLFGVVSITRKDMWNYNSQKTLEHKSSFLWTTNLSHISS